MPADWERPPRGRIDLEAGALHIWRAPLDLDEPVLTGICEPLSEGERERAGRFRSPALARRFRAGRGLVRDILSRYLDAPAAALRFAAGERGKPALEEPHAWLRFNASNSGGVTLVAVTAGRDVGVDVEELRPVPEAMAIAERMLSPREQERLRSLAPADRELAFLHCWTRKEAFIKAIGTGLWAGLDNFDVAFGPGEEPCLLAVDGSAERAAGWTLRALDPGPGTVGAVVVAGPIGRLRTLAWTAP